MSLSEESNDVSKQKCVLLIDDNEHQHELFRVYALGKDKLNLSFAHSLEDAVPLLSEGEADLVLLDNRLQPYENFRMSVPVIREKGYEGRIVVISADIDNPAFNEFRTVGVHKCLNKFDFTLDNFENLIETLLD